MGKKKIILTEIWSIWTLWNAKQRHKNRDKEKMSINFPITGHATSLRLNWCRFILSPIEAFQLNCTFRTLTHHFEFHVIALKFKKKKITFEINSFKHANQDKILHVYVFCYAEIAYSIAPFSIACRHVLKFQTTMRVWVFFSSFVLFLLCENCFYWNAFIVDFH